MRANWTRSAPPTPCTTCRSPKGCKADARLRPSARPAPGGDRARQLPRGPGLGHAPDGGPRLRAGTPTPRSTSDCPRRSDGSGTRADTSSREVAGSSRPSTAPAARRRRQLAECLGAYANLLIAQGAPERAGELALAEPGDGARRSGDEKREAYAMGVLGTAQLHQGDVHSARQTFEDALVAASSDRRPGSGSIAHWATWPESRRSSATLPAPKS